ncbi:NAD(P)-binding protein [Cristinia sonorae]|uniref:NAD(P)-binding protein n=1 Tax=Cristinia sonorae TaxID=1940300 RepID=A0A8K0URE8_9AGAR|nr:NAD(P)-binding protein [Cristinia sonorae]
MSKLILVIGATGAQGNAVINKLLEPCADGSPSPYRVRALTRDPNSRRAQVLTAKGVECVKGAFEDFAAVKDALQGVYGAWVNVDGFTVGEQKEIYAGMIIFELAKRAGTVRHYVWSSLDYGFKKGKYDPIYRCDHYDAKGRVAEWMAMQASEAESMTWSVVTTGPYMDMLYNVGLSLISAVLMMFGPLNRRADGTHVFASPIGNGHVPMIALTDLGFFARYTFDHRQETSGRELEVASDMVGWKYLIETFTKVSGKKAVFVNQSLDEWFENFEGVDMPVANERHAVTGEGGNEGWTTWRKNFSGWWALWRDDVIKRDLEWIRSVNPGGHTLESWMREKNYGGEWRRDVLKNAEDGKSITPKWDRLATL